MAFVGVSSAGRVMEHWIPNPTDPDDYNYELKYHFGGNPDCADIQCDGLYVMTNNAVFLTPGTHSLQVYGRDFEYNVHSDGNFDWSVSPGTISGVILWGGDEANVYKYSPAVSGDTGLSIPTKSDGTPFVIGRLHFCGIATGIESPEFPSAFLPAAMIIGFLGAVLIIQRTREQ